MLQKAFGDKAIYKSQKNVYKWYKDFKEGRERVQDEQRLGRPLTSTDESHIKEIKDLLFENRRLTIRDLADATDRRCNDNTPWCNDENTNLELSPKCVNAKSRDTVVSCAKYTQEQSDAHGLRDRPVSLREALS
ncbi:putative uncharacterized protein FLJ37770 [Harpegnathos saltator]|uniref:putative uncharacterized protein FLJ37770 n=1 Tax=Harpegnathos saltator TaxID=610380 RepID=UPI000DBEE004|nr:putative uncharacterized protein FLJ37770 [Harpegnathos saltator]